MSIDSSRRTRTVAARRYRRLRRAAAATVAALLAGGVLAACGGSSGGVPTINFYNQPSGANVTQATINRCNTLAKGQYKIKLQLLPSSADQQRQQLVRRLAAKDASIDLMGLDVTWESEFWEAGWIREWTGANKAAVTKDALPGPLSTATVAGGQLVAAPYNSNTQLLWYRADLVKTPPKTWDEMLQMSAQLHKEGKPSAIEEQGAQYEGVTVWFNSLVASAGGSILNSTDTKPSLGAPALKALQIMKKMATQPGAADPSLSVSQEGPSQLAFEAGNAAFEINYPFVWPAMQQDNPKVKTYNGKSLKANFRWAPFPSVTPGVTSKSSIGGIDIAVSKFSKHPTQAYAAALCLVDTDSQEINANQGGLPPVGKSLYQNPPKDFAKAYPFYQLIEQQLQNGSVRPKTAAYQSVSIVISHLVSPPDSINPKSALKKMNSQIKDALASKGLIP